MNIRNLKNGILGGLAGGAVSGMMMPMMAWGWASPGISKLLPRCFRA